MLAPWESEGFSLALDSSDVYWAVALPGGDGGHLAGANGKIMSVPKTGGTPTVFAEGQPECGGLTVVGGSLYWTTATPGTLDAGFIVTAPIGGGAPSTLISS